MLNKTLNLILKSRRIAMEFDRLVEMEEQVDVIEELLLKEYEEDAKQI